MIIGTALHAQNVFNIMVLQRMEITTRRYPSNTTQNSTQIITAKNLTEKDCLPVMDSANFVLEIKSSKFIN